MTDLGESNEMFLCVRSNLNDALGRNVLTNALPVALVSVVMTCTVELKCR